MSQYGVEIETRRGVADEEALESCVAEWLRAAAHGSGGAYALNEWSDLYNAETHQLSRKDEDMEPVYTKGELIIYWLDEDGKLCKQHKEHRVYGYVNQALKNDNGFDWDSIFVNAVTGKSYAESIPLWGKCTPRQLLISDFIQQHLFYKKHSNLKFVEYTPEQTVSFVSVAQEMKANPLLDGNANLADFGLDRFVQHAIRDGIHLRFARNRRENNYWMPGLNGGLPAVAKPDAIHETTYRFHDLMHYGLAPVCDVLPTDNFGPSAHRVYHAARKMSKAFSLVMADMLFVDSLNKSGLRYEYSSRNVYPLFRCMNLPLTRSMSDLRELFRATTLYGLLGDDSALRNLLRSGPPSQKALDSFREWYSRFFSGDHLWTTKNFLNLSRQADDYAAWRLRLGDSLFTRARLSFLNDAVKKISDKGTDMSSYREIVWALFDEVFDTHVLPRVAAAPKGAAAEEEYPTRSAAT